MWFQSANNWRMPTDALRSEAAILGDLQDLCAEPGFLHAYAWLCIRDNFAYFTEEYDAEVVKEFHARSQLVRSELNTLLGLTVKAGVDDSSVSMDTVTGYVSQADKLLGELHQTMNQPVVESLKAAIDAGSDDNPFASGSMMREPIFYAGDSAYVSQYLELFPEKYAMKRPGFRRGSSLTRPASAGPGSDCKQPRTSRG